MSANHDHVASDSEGSPEAEALDRARKVSRAAMTWTGELIDLGGRNTLLYYKDLKQGTLDLGPESGAASVAVDQMLSFRTVRLSQLFNADGISATARRARTVKAKAVENFEERGLERPSFSHGAWLDGRTCAERQLRRLRYFSVKRRWLPEEESPRTST